MDPIGGKAAATRGFRTGLGVGGVVIVITVLVASCALIQTAKPRPSAPGSPSTIAGAPVSARATAASGDGPDIQYSAKTAGPDGTVFSIEPSSPSVWPGATTHAPAVPGATRTPTPTAAPTPTATPTPVPTPFTPVILASESFEHGVGQWTGGGSPSSGWFANPGATLTQAPKGKFDGNYGLTVVTSDSDYGSGALWDVSGPTYLAGHSYRFSVALYNNTDSPLQAYFGLDIRGSADAASNTNVPSSVDWQWLVLTWTPQATTASPVRLVVRKWNPGAATFYLDQAQIYQMN